MMNKIRRIVAGLSALLIIGLIIAMIVLAIMGSLYFYGVLFLTLVIPVILWVFMWFTHLVQKDPKTENEVEKKED